MTNLIDNPPKDCVPYNKWATEELKKIASVMTMAFKDNATPDEIEARRVLKQIEDGKL